MKILSLLGLVIKNNLVEELRLNKGPESVSFLSCDLICMVHIFIREY